MRKEYPDYVWKINERQVEFEPADAMEVIIQTPDPELFTREKKVRQHLVSIVHI